MVNHAPSKMAWCWWRDPPDVSPERNRGRPARIGIDRHHGLRVAGHVAKAVSELPPKKVRVLEPKCDG